MNKDFVKTLQQVKKVKNFKKSKNVIWESFLKKKCPAKCGRTLKVAILNAPCHGFGDIIFAQKLSKYIKDWYGAKVHIFTTQPASHIQLGEKKANIVSATKVGKNTQCRTFASLNFPKSKDKYDLYLVAPFVNDYTPNINVFIKKFKYATRSNIFIFSEYDATPMKDFDFNTGVGRGHDGMLLVDPPAYGRRMGKLKNPYAVIYIASDEHIARANTCYLGFMELIVSKYHKTHKKLDVVVPQWIVDNIFEFEEDKLVKKLRKFYPRILVKDKEGTEDLTEDFSTNKSDRTFTIRGDIFPLANKKMFNLMHFSINDILLTGDQSITDALSCCGNKNIFYQIAEWKEKLGKALAKELPNPHLARKTTSCGTLKAIKYKSNYKKFFTKWDFRKLGRVKLDAIVLAANAVKKNKKYKELANVIDTSKTVASLKKKASKL